MSKKERISDSEMEQAERDTETSIDKEETINIVINDDGTGPWTGCINGVWKEYQRGVLVEIPKSMYNLIRSSASIMEQNKRIAEAHKM